MGDVLNLKCLGLQICPVLDDESRCRWNRVALGFEKRVSKAVNVNHLRSVFEQNHVTKREKEDAAFELAGDTDVVIGVVGGRFGRVQAVDAGDIGDDRGAVEEGRGEAELVLPGRVRLFRDLEFETQVSRGRACQICAG